MQIYVDVTCTAYNPRISGIGRVVLSVVLEWIKQYPDQVVLLYWDQGIKKYRILENERFAACFTGETKSRKFFGKRTMAIDDFGEGMTLFEVDSVWVDYMKRSYLLPRLKARGVKIAAFIHDILCITEPKYFDARNSLTCIEALCAQIQYADVLIATTQATIDAITELVEGTDVTLCPTYVVPLASDFAAAKKGEVAKKDPKTILMVGTLEPRKNHAYTLDAFDQGLFAAGYHLVLAGHVGWKTQELMERIYRHPLYGTQLFHLGHASDEEIASLYATATAVAFPSHGEGYGLPVVEALLQGVPIICSDIPVLREVGGDYALYCDLADPMSLVDQVRSLEDAAIYQALRERIASYQPRRWQQTATEIYEILTQQE